MNFILLLFGWLKMEKNKMKVNFVWIERRKEIKGM